LEGGGGSTGAPQALFVDVGDILFDSSPSDNSNNDQKLTNSSGSEVKGILRTSANSEPKEKRSVRFENSTSTAPRGGGGGGRGRGRGGGAPATGSGGGGRGRGRGGGGGPSDYSVDEEIEKLIPICRRLCNQQGTFTFGQIFYDDEAAGTFESLVGTLKAAKKRGIVAFKAEVLLQGAHNAEVIKLLV